MRKLIKLERIEDGKAVETKSFTEGAARKVLSEPGTSKYWRKSADQPQVAREPKVTRMTVATPEAPLESRASVQSPAPVIETPPAKTEVPPPPPPPPAEDEEELPYQQLMEKIKTTEDIGFLQGLLEDERKTVRAAAEARLTEIA